MQAIAFVPQTSNGPRRLFRSNTKEQKIQRQKTPSVIRSEFQEIMKLFKRWGQRFIRLEFQKCWTEKLLTSKEICFCLVQLHTCTVSNPCLPKIIWFYHTPITKKYHQARPFNIQQTWSIVTWHTQFLNRIDGCIQIHDDNGICFWSIYLLMFVWSKSV